MKALSLGSLLAMGLVLAVGEVRAAMMQSSGGNPPQQLTTSCCEMAASGSLGASQPVFTGHGGGPELPAQTAAQFAQPGHTIVHPQPAPIHNIGRRPRDPSHIGGFRHGFGFDHNRFQHHRFIVVFVNGTPCWYPVYTAYPCYYDSPPPIIPGSAVYTPGDGYVPSTDADTGQSAPEYSDLGASWGQDLRREIVTWDQFVAYLEAYIVTAPPSAQADFREAFISAYRINGAAAYDKAAAEAAGKPPQPLVRRS